MTSQHVNAVITTIVFYHSEVVAIVSSYHSDVVFAVVPMIFNVKLVNIVNKT